MAHRSIWVAIRDERGFPVEAKGFLQEEKALAQQDIWRAGMNPDYDETGVLELDLAHEGECPMLMTST